MMVKRERHCRLVGYVRKRPQGWLLERIFAGLWQAKVLLVSVSANTYEAQDNQTKNKTETME